MNHLRQFLDSKNGVFVDEIIKIESPFLLTIEN